MDTFSETLHWFTLQAIPILIKSIFPSMYRSPFQYFLLKMCFFLTRIITPLGADKQNPVHLQISHVKILFI